MYTHKGFPLGSVLGPGVCFVTSAHPEEDVIPCGKQVLVYLLEGKRDG